MRILDLCWVSYPRSSVQSGLASFWSHPTHKTCYLKKLHKLLLTWSLFIECLPNVIVKDRSCMSIKLLSHFLYRPTLHSLWLPSPYSASLTRSKVRLYRPIGACTSVWVNSPGGVTIWWFLLAWTAAVASRSSPCRSRCAIGLSYIVISDAIHSSVSPWSSWSSWLVLIADAELAGVWSTGFWRSNRIQPVS